MNALFSIIDLTHTLTSHSPSWSGGREFSKEVQLDYESCESEVKFRVHRITMHAGIGTHMDSPAHCIPQGQTIDEMALEQFIAPCVVINLSKDCHERLTVGKEAISAFEENFGTISPGSFVILYTGWDRYWEDRDRYRNSHVFPSVSIEAAQYLLSKKIVGIGIDTLSPDRPEDGFLVHDLILGNGKYIVENVCNAAMMPPTGGYTFALPMKMGGATEAPVRLVGFVPK